MTRPGTQVVMKAAPPSRGQAVNSGVAFYAGVAQRGRTDQAVAIHNMDEYAKYLGARVSNGLLYDACDAGFASGLTTIYAGRAVGSSAAVDTATFVDSGSAASIAVDTLGEFDSAWNAQVLSDGGGKAHVVVTDPTNSNAIMSQSPSFSAPTDFANWSQNDPFIRIRALGSNVPAATSAVGLSGGTDNFAGINDTTKAASMTKLFPKGLGIGQLAFPGATTTAMHVSLAALALATNRVAVLDLVDTADENTLIAEAAAIRAATAATLGETYVFGPVPWHIVPGITANTTRTIPPSAVTCGLIARSDGNGNNVNVPAAGANGIADFILGLSQPEWTDLERQALNDAGISVYREMFGSVRLYGYRTLADQNLALSAAWDSFAAARLRMVMVADFEAVAEEFQFSEVDGRGHKIAEWNGALVGVCQKYWAMGALFGNSAPEAFIVDTGPNVNTPTTIQNKELHAKIGIRTSPFNELSVIEVTKVPVTEGL